MIPARGPNYGVRTRHVTYGDKRMLIGDEAAEVLLEYAAQVVRTGGGDSVTMRAIDPDGNDVEVSFLLGSGVTLMSQTATTSVEEPDNAHAIASMRERLGALQSPSHAHTFTEDEAREMQGSHLELEL